MEFDSLEQSKKVAEYEKKIAEAQANIESNTADAVDYQILIRSKGLVPSSNRVRGLVKQWGKVSSMKDTFKDELEDINNQLIELRKELELLAH